MQQSINLSIRAASRSSSSGASLSLLGQNQSEVLTKFKLPCSPQTDRKPGQKTSTEPSVADFVGARVRVSGLLLAQGLGFGWLLALSTALPVSCTRKGGTLWGLPFTILLAVPTAAMATACILTEAGGHVLVLSLLIAAREFKFLRTLFEGAWRSPHLLQGRAQGLTWGALVRMHILPTVSTQVWALVTLSIVTALGALVPIEVIFNVPGVGQLAWSAVMNRDLPVLVVVSL